MVKCVKTKVPAAYAREHCSSPVSFHFTSNVFIYSVHNSIIV